MGKRGPQPLGNTVELRTTISPQIDDALDQLAAISNISKSTMVRHALLMTLAVVGLLPEDAPAGLAVTTIRTAKTKTDRNVK